MNVPSATAMTVVTSAMISEFCSAVVRSVLANGCSQCLQREALPGEVEAPLVVVERVEDDDEDRDEEVQQRQARPDPQQPVADAVVARASDAPPVSDLVPSNRA